MAIPGDFGARPKRRATAGFVQTLTLSRPRLRETFGERAADELVAASEDTVRAIGAWCESDGVDAWYRAFNIQPGNRLYLPPEQRVHIW